MSLKFSTSLFDSSSVSPSSDLTFFLSVSTFSTPPTIFIFILFYFSCDGDFLVERSEWCNKMKLEWRERTLPLLPPYMECGPDIVALTGGWRLELRRTSSAFDIVINFMGKDCSYLDAISIYQGGKRYPNVYEGISHLWKVFLGLALDTIEERFFWYRVLDRFNDLSLFRNNHTHLECCSSF